MSDAPIDPLSRDPKGLNGDHAFVEIAHGVWRALARLPEPALLFTSKKFEVVALNPAALVFFESAPAERVSRWLERSLSKLLVERICLAARAGSGGFVGELPAQLTVGDNQVRIVRLSVLPMGGASDGAGLAVLYLREVAAEQQISESYTKLPRELLTWLPLPAWLVDAHHAVVFQNANCSMLPFANTQSPETLDLNTIFRATTIPGGLGGEFVDAMRTTEREAQVSQRISDQIVSAAGQVWRVVHLPITGVDGKPYRLGIALGLSKHLAGSLEAPAGGDQAYRQELQSRARNRERMKLAREVHDSLGQELTVLRLSLDRLIATARAELPLTEDHEAQLSALQSQMQLVISSSRTIAFQLRHDLVQTMGLVSAVEHLVAQFRTRLALAGQLEVGSGWADPEPVSAGNIYRATQELLNNVAKHAQASKFLVRLNKRGEEYQLEVLDNGVGVPLDRREGARGLKNMQERVEAHQGSMLLQTRPVVEGTRIVLTFHHSQDAGFGETTY